MEAFRDKDRALVYVEAAREPGRYGTPADKVRALEAFDRLLEKRIPADAGDDDAGNTIDRGKFIMAREQIARVRQRWQTLAGCLDPVQIDNPYVDSRSNGLVYTRSFKHADVWVDIGKREGKVVWN